MIKKNIFVKNNPLKIKNKVDIDMDTIYAIIEKEYLQLREARPSGAGGQSSNTTRNY